VQRVEACGRRAARHAARVRRRRILSHRPCPERPTVAGAAAPPVFCWQRRRRQQRRRRARRRGCAVHPRGGVRRPTAGLPSQPRPLTPVLARAGPSRRAYRGFDAADRRRGGARGLFVFEATLSGFRIRSTGLTTGATGRAVRAAVKVAAGGLFCPFYELSGPRLMPPGPLPACRTRCSARRAAVRRPAWRARDAVGPRSARASQRPAARAPHEPPPPWGPPVRRPLQRLSRAQKHGQRGNHGRLGQGMAGFAVLCGRRAPERPGGARGARPRALVGAAAGDQTLAGTSAPSTRWMTLLPAITFIFLTWGWGMGLGVGLGVGWGVGWGGGG
jgi:hypothetical protein